MMVPEMRMIWAEVIPKAAGGGCPFRLMVCRLVQTTSWLFILVVIGNV
jgi:hypothetical protein